MVLGADAVAAQHLAVACADDNDGDPADLTPTAAGLETRELATDGMSATLRLRAGQAFHSGAPVTADDLLVQLRLVEQDRNSSDALDNKPAGSGPFRLVDFRPGVSISLERFDDYHEPDLPYLDQIDFTIFDEANTMVSALQSGEIDVAWYIPAQAAESLEAEGFQVAELEGPAVVLNVAMNPTQPPFDDRLVRRAIQRAINRQRIIDDVYFGFGQALGLPSGLSSRVENQLKNLGAAGSGTDTSHMRPQTPRYVTVIGS